MKTSKNDTKVSRVRLTKAVMAVLSVISAIWVCGVDGYSLMGLIVSGAVLTASWWGLLTKTEYGRSLLYDGDTSHDNETR